jgi:peptidoglycan hydrolase-like protein with peptidoglycan-binding domain
MRARFLSIALAAAVAVAGVGCGGGGDEAAGETDLVDTGDLFAPISPEPVEEEPAAPAEEEPSPPPAGTGEALQIQVPKTGESIGPDSPAARVAELQQALLQLGYKVGKSDGIYGGKTRKAVRAFQKSQKLEVDGLVGPRTARAINKALRQLAKNGGADGGSAAAADDGST